MVKCTALIIFLLYFIPIKTYAQRYGHGSGSGGGFDGGTVSNQTTFTKKVIINGDTLQIGNLLLVDQAAGALFLGNGANTGIRAQEYRISGAKALSGLGPLEVGSSYSNVHVGSAGSSTIEFGIGVDPAEAFHIDVDGNGAGIGIKETNSFISTTDASATTIFTLGTTTDRGYRFTVEVIGVQDDGTNEFGATWKATVKNSGGTVTETGETILDEQDTSTGTAATISGTVSGTDYLIQVTGIAAENWNFQAGVKYVEVTH